MKIIRYIYIVCFVFGITHNAVAQKRSDSKEIVGFGCGFAGVPSKAVKSMAKLLQEDSYSRLRKKLFKGNLAEQYLAVLFCEELQERNQIVLTKEEMEQIAEMYNSAKSIFICSGCTVLESRNIATLLKSKKADATLEFGSGARAWVARALDNAY